MLSYKDKISVLHLTYDLRLRNKGEVTNAVKNLITESSAFSNPYVVSLIRVPNFREQYAIRINLNQIDLNIFGLPFGILLKQHLNYACKTIYRYYSDIIDKKGPIDIIHAHKLTFEGLIGYHFAKRLEVPLLFTIRQTDFSVLKNKPHLRHVYRNVIKYSTKIIYLVPFMKEKFKPFWSEQFFAENIQPKLTFLPNIIKKETTPVVSLPKDFYLLSIFWMTQKTIYRKSIKNLLCALSKINDTSLKLKIIGDGPYLNYVKKWTEQLGLNNKVQFLGKIPNHMIDQYYREATAFLLPSKSESFGMVYAEALMNGTPILYSQNTGFDGLFEGVGVKVDPYSVKSIQNGIEEIIKYNHNFRKNIIELQKQNAFDIFLPHSVRDRYRNIIINSLK